MLLPSQQFRRFVSSIVLLVLALWCMISTANVSTPKSSTTTHTATTLLSAFLPSTRLRSYTALIQRSARIEFASTTSTTTSTSRMSNNNDIDETNGDQVEPNPGNRKSRKSNNHEKRKRIVFLRHGRTYMNELINGIHYGGPNFTDIFPDIPEYREKYYDSPLSPTGVDQAKQLYHQLEELQLANRQMVATTTIATATNRTNNEEEGLPLQSSSSILRRWKQALDDLNLSEDDAHFLDDLDLIVTSPHTRALQTLEIGLLPHIHKKHQEQEYHQKKKKIPPPIIALPHAAERLYLVSDLGTPRSQLAQSFDYVDFDTGFDIHKDDETPWHYHPSNEQAENYIEWRPNGQGQQYACLGEPQEQFDQRMTNLYQWLYEKLHNSTSTPRTTTTKKESSTTIVVVCHWGVIDWMLQESFQNCELRVVSLEDLKPRALINDSTF